MIAPTSQSDTQLARVALGPPLRRNILFASAPSIVDSSNGASVATPDVLRGLAAAGFECQAFCTPRLDFHTEVCFEDVVGATREPFRVQPSICGSERARVLSTRRQAVPITIIRLESTRHVSLRAEELQTVLEFFEKFLDVYRPDVVITYGGDPTTLGMIAIAKRRGIPVVFAIHNFAYAKLHLFAQVDYCIVPSRFAQRFYRDQAGVLAHARPNPVDWQRVRAEGGQSPLRDVHQSVAAQGRLSARPHRRRAVIQGVKFGFRF